jgi:hypothetical protein
LKIPSQENIFLGYMIPDAHGNSSNDLPMLYLANKMKSEHRNRLGYSFWVGEVSDVASYSFRNVDTLQHGVIGLAGHVKSIGW